MQPNESESPATRAPEAASPFPPPFRWDSSPSPEEAPTQVMRAVGWDIAQGDVAAVTRAVRASDVGDSERTQVLRAIPPYAQRPQEVGDLFRPGGAAPGGRITAPGDRSDPPWNDVEPFRAPAFQAPAAQSPAFQPSAAQSSSAGSRSTQITGITVLAVVVLGLVAATVAYLLIPGPGRTDDDPTAISPPASAPRDLPPPHPSPVNTADALINPGGTDRGSNTFGGVLELAKADLLPDSIVEALSANGMSDAVLKATLLPVGANQVKIGMYAFTLPDPQKALTVTRDIVNAEVLGDDGLKIDNANALRGVTVMRSVPGSTGPVYRAVYVLYNRVIYFEVFGSSRADAETVLNTFTSLVDKQVITHAPPTIRGS